MTAPVEVKVYAPDGSTLIGTGAVPRRTGVRWRDENNGVGIGQFDLHLADAYLASYPSLLDPFNIVKFRPAGATDPVFAWQLENLEVVRVDSDEAAGRKASISGRHVRSLLDTARVTGEGDSRAFNFSSPDLPGYPTGWDTPVGVQQGSDPTARGGAPVGWTEPTAEWIWSTDPTVTAPSEFNWFRAELTLASETDVSFWASADNWMSLHVNGVEVVSTDITDWYAWRSIARYHQVLPAGTHTIAAKAFNAAQTVGNPGGFLCVVGVADAQGNPDTVLLQTNTTDWVVRPADDPPGWRAAQILDVLLTEAQADGDLAADITWDFDGTLDSDGASWDDLRDVQISVGTDLLTVSNMWAGTVYDIDMTPDLVLHAYKRRGSDLSATVALTPNVDVTSVAPSAGYDQIRNVVRFRHDGTWHEVVDATSVTAYGRRVATLSFGDAGSVDEATQLATEALNDLAHPQTTIPVGTTSALGDQPYDAYNLGDTISGPALLSGQADARVMAIGGVEQNNRIDWTTDLYPET